MRRRFVTLDVFTDTRFAGNPLAVVLEPDGLDTAAMQTIAREFNCPRPCSCCRRPTRRTARSCASSRRRASCRSPVIRRSARRCCSGASTAGRSARDFVLEEKHRAGAVPGDVIRRRRGPRGVRHSAPAAEDRRPARRRDDRGGARPRGRAISASTDSRPRAGRRATRSPSCRCAGSTRSARCRIDTGAIRGRHSAATRTRRPSCSAARPPSRAIDFHARMFAPGVGRARGSGDRLGGGGVRGLSRGARRLPRRRAPRRASSRATRWAARA